MGALPHEEGALAQDLFALSGGFGGDVNFADHSSAQKSGKDVGIDLIVLDLGLGDDACLEGVGQDDVFMRKMRLKELVEPSPVHGGLENHTAAGMSLDQVNEELWCAVVDAPFFKDAVGGINRAKNTVSLGSRFR